MTTSMLRVAAGLALAAGAAVAGPEYRTIDGSGNNIANPTWGMAGVHLQRICPADYADGVSQMAGQDRLGARWISNIVVDQPEMVFNDRGLTDWTWQWGQFIDHDLDLTDAQSSAAFIEVPVGDPFFDPEAVGGQVIPFRRSNFDFDTGTDPKNPRQHENELTAYIDGSAVYGSTQARADWLRTFSGGRMKVSDTVAGTMLPYNDGSQSMSFVGNDVNSFVAGDNRANEQTGLAAVHALFVLEHNRLADLIALGNPSLTDEEIYQRARAIVSAEIQVITYKEFLPSLLGNEALPSYQGYNAGVNASIATEFSTVLYRIGHTMLSPMILRLDENFEPIPEGHLALRDAFFDASILVDNGGLAPIFRGLAYPLMQEVDIRVIDDVRNFLFGNLPPFQLDLISLNIQRGRDHGIGSYNAIRTAYGLAPKASFAEISSDPAVVASLAEAYETVDDIDAWIGTLCEEHVAGSSVGELMMVGLVDQFTRCRDGDRFWYQIDPFLPTALADAGYNMQWIEDLRLSGVIRWNTDADQVQNNVFRVPLVGDVDDDGSVGFPDLNALLGNYGSTTGGAGDVDGDGDVDFADLNLLLGNYGASY